MYNLGKKYDLEFKYLTYNLWSKEIKTVIEKKLLKTMLKIGKIR